ncbi:MAG: NUDIX hydrolase [Proteobacteria bacterium]|nr:NUDIX hydrolase [Pseudomonadota bacterium]
MNEWIEWTKQIKAIAQIGIEYTKEAYDLERYQQLTKIAHEMISKLADAPISKVNNFFVPDSGYATPKVDLRAGIIQEGKILLVKERSDGKWTLPGGWADVNEGPSAGIVREVREETGYEVRVNRLIAVKDRSLHPYTPQYPNHIYKLFFICDLIGGEPVVNTEISEIDFFKIESLPTLSESRVLKEDIQSVFEYCRKNITSVYCD